jgi:hypothetical protein
VRCEMVEILGIVVGAVFLIGTMILIAEIRK